MTNAILRDVRGLSKPVTMLLILASSVLLASSISYYASSMSSTQSKEETLTIRYPHVWVNSTGSTAALVLTPTGGRDIVVDKITIRGAAISFSDVYLWRASDAGVSVTSDLNVTKNAMGATGSSISVSVMGSSRTFTQASSLGGQIPLSIGQSVVLYVDTSSMFSSSNIGLTTSITVLSADLSWTKQVNIESATR